MHRDDVFSETREEHLAHVRMATLRRRRLHAKPSKCRFGRSSAGFLGLEISEPGAAVDPRKAAAGEERATPAPRTPRWPRQLLAQVCLTLLRHGSPAHGRLQPPG